MHPVGWEQGYAEGRGVGFTQPGLVQWFQSNRSLGIGLVGRQGELPPLKGETDTLSRWAKGCVCRSRCAVCAIVGCVRWRHYYHEIARGLFAVHASLHRLDTFDHHHRRNNTCASLPPLASL
jgi:hypothetical protein